MKYLLPVFLLVACGGTEIVYVPEPGTSTIVATDAGVPAPDAKAPDAKVSAPDAKSPFLGNQTPPKDGCLSGEYDEVITPTSSSCASFPVGVGVAHAMVYRGLNCQNFWDFSWYDGGPDSCRWRGKWTFLGFFNTAGYTAKLTMEHICPASLADQSCSFIADVKAVQK